ncbi:MAG: toll/interleukin-1 receptor domain-containing protein [Candidatus Cloacimonetes bacterium]|nr:toll/interleukin-1 receptor domain-containing protein [Candidatus Cloacimonadota bacterium]
MKKCFCNKSKTYPICDGGHSGLKWSCKAKDSVIVDYAFFTSPKLENMSLKAAHHFDGASHINLRNPVSCETGVYFSDGTDFSILEKWIPKIDASNYYLVLLGHKILVPNLPKNWKVIRLRDDSQHPLLELQTIMNHKVDLISPIKPKIFLSHSVADESQIQNLVDYLRKYLDLEIFLCGDSLISGHSWYNEIEKQLNGCNHFILINSKTVVSSTFCAYEAGMAKALNKKISIISLDGSPPAAYFQHLHMFDCPRLQQSKPWLDPHEILIESFYKILV